MGPAERAFEALRAMPEERQPQTGGGKMGQSARPPEPEAIETAPQIETAEPEAIEVKPQIETAKPKTPQQQPVINNNYYTQQHHYDHSMHFYPYTGEIEIGPRFRQI